MTESTKPLMTPTEVAERLRISEITLKRWRLDGYGPKPYFLSPRTIRYRPAEVDQWLMDNGAGESSEDQDQ